MEVVDVAREGGRLDMNCGEVIRKACTFFVLFNIGPHWFRLRKVTVKHGHIMPQISETCGVFPTDCSFSPAIRRKIVAG
jgi:hypothetical protein